MIVKNLPHLVAVLHVETLAVELEAAGVIEIRGGTDAEQRVVVGVVCVGQIVCVIGGNQREAEVRGHLDELRVHLILGRDAMALHLEVVAIAEDALELLRDRPGSVGLSLNDRPGHRCRQTTRSRDQPLVSAPQEIHVDPGLVVEPLEIPLRDEVHQVPVAGLVHRQQQQVADGVEAIGGALPPLLLEATPTRDIDLAADDRLDAVGPRLLVELDGSEEIAVIRLGHGRHVHGLGALEERVVLDRPVEQRVLGMKMQVNERLRHVNALPGQ